MPVRDSSDVPYDSLCIVHSLQRAQDLEASYLPYTCQRQNIEERIQLYTVELGRLSPPKLRSGNLRYLHDELLAPAGNSANHGGQVDSQCTVALQPLGVTYTIEANTQQLGAVGKLFSTSSLTIDIPLPSGSSNPSRQMQGINQIPLDSDQSDQGIELECRRACEVGLARAYWDLYAHTDDTDDLALQLTYATLALMRSSTLSVDALYLIGAALFMRYKHARSIGDLEAALGLFGCALNSISASHWAMISLHAEFGETLLSKYDLDGDSDKLERALSMLNAGLSTAEQTHPARYRITHTLSQIHHFHYLKFGQAEHIDQELHFTHDTYNLCPPGHIYRAAALFAMGRVTLQAYEFGSDQLEDLDQAIRYHRESLDAYSPTHSVRSKILSNLCYQLKIRFYKFGSDADLDEAILIGRQAAQSIPFFEGSLFNLANALTTRHQQSGTLADLDEAIQLFRRMLGLCGPGHSRRDLLAQGIGDALMVRYAHTSDLRDLAEALAFLRESAELRPPGHPDWAVTQSLLAEALTAAYHRTADLQSLEEALALFASWLEHRPELEPGWRGELSLSVLGTLHRLQYQRSGDVRDLDAAIESQEEALCMLVKQHYRRHMTMHDLATTYQLRALTSNCTKDAKRAMELQSEALRSLMIGHRDRARILLGLARLHVQQMLPEHSVDAALDLYCTAITDGYCGAQVRLTEGQIVLQMIQHCATYGGLTTNAKLHLLEAYHLTMRLLPQIAYFGLNANSRFRALEHAPNLATEAAVHAIAMSRLRTAVELLEEGRAVFWVQYLRLRSSFDQLPNDLANELAKASHDLEVNARQLSGPPTTGNEDVAQYEQRLVDNRRLSEHFDSLISKARTLPGLERFLLNETFSALALVAQAAPVVILLATAEFCGAVILRNERAEPEAVSFGKDMNVGMLVSMSRAVIGSGRTSRGAIEKTRAMKRISAKESTGNGPYGEIWQQIMQPVVQALRLEKSVGRCRRRLVLCATGQFAHVPLHAAGTDVEGCWDYFVPTYTPTLGALLNARRSFVSIRRSSARTFLAAVPLPFKWARLGQTVTEIEHLKAIIPSHLVTTCPPAPNISAGLSGSASCADVLDGMPEATILHLACHGYHDPANPLDSGFVMRDKMLTVPELMALNLPHAFLAFLSACETARAPEDQPDQAVHLAATMLFTGFKSVIGTMWSMNDIDGPIVAKRVYEELFRGDDEYLHPDCVPYALDAAVHELRGQNLHPSRWAPYVHFGI